ncbi:MAG: type II toxin-antitoxin system RelE/ParE family toxin [Terriglobia bacterium]
MNHRLLVRRPAKADIWSATRWYELRWPELGREFLAEVDAALDRVAEKPLQYQVVHRDVRRAIIHRFPFAVFYRVEASRIVVFCVSHLHRDPALWKRRTEGKS